MKGGKNATSWGGKENGNGGKNEYFHDKKGDKNGHSKKVGGTKGGDEKREKAGDQHRKVSRSV